MPMTIAPKVFSSKFSAIVTLELASMRGLCTNWEGNGVVVGSCRVPGLYLNQDTCGVL